MLICLSLCKKNLPNSFSQKNSRRVGLSIDDHHQSTCFGGGPPPPTPNPTPTPPQEQAQLARQREDVGRDHVAKLEQQRTLALVCWVRGAAQRDIFPVFLYFTFGSRYVSCFASFLGRFFFCPVGKQNCSLHLSFSGIFLTVYFKSSHSPLGTGSGD